MKSGERKRLVFVFLLLGCIPAFIGCWLIYVQVLQAGELQRDGRSPLRLNDATADRQGQRTERTPAARGSIVDRNGKPLAFDREVYEVRADIVVPRRLREDVTASRAWLADLAGELATALASDPELADRKQARQVHLQRLTRLIEGAFRLEQLPAADPNRQVAVPEDHRVRADVLLSGSTDVLSVIDALRGLGQRRDLRGLVTLHFLPAFERAYPDRELTHGIVGHTGTSWVDGEDDERRLVTYGKVGLESAQALDAGGGAERAFLRDGRGRTYFVGQSVAADPLPVLHSTLDVEMQRIAMRELSAAAEAGAREGTVTIPKWGALVLVEIATGDVLAAASWHRGSPNPQSVPWTPYQSLFEPGSIVKPLVLGYASQAGQLDWSQVYDCRPGSGEYRERIAAQGRSKPVKDEHVCGDLNAHGIIVNSSNIGAAYIGLGLDRAQWRDYMSYYGFGESLGLQMPHESVGGWPRQSFDPATPLRSFRGNSAISFSFGYEFQVTAMHVARAYLRLLTGGRADLRVCRGVDHGGKWYPAPSAKGGAELSTMVVAQLLGAMTDVMGSDPHATGSLVRGLLQKELGVDVYGKVAGKTGTAASLIGIRGRGTVAVRNASFVGLMPARAPRWLVVCVLQKDDSARFFGGSYAAPPALRLLLQVDRLAVQRIRSMEPRPSDGQIR